MSVAANPPTLARLLHLRPYVRLFVAGFRRQSAYLAAAFGGLAANVTFGFLKAAILVATVQAAGGEVGGYDAGQMLAYVWVGQAMLGLVNMYGRDVIGDRIRSGDIVIDFLRPLHLQAAGLASYLGERLFSLLPRGIPTLTIGLLTTGMALPGSAWPYLVGAFSVLLGMVVSYLVVFALNILGLWLVETRGLYVLYSAVAGLLSGLFVPVDLLPGWLRAVAEATPFPSIMMTPIEVITGRITGSELLTALGTQVGWVLLMAALGAALTSAGRRRMEVQGG